MRAWVKDWGNLFFDVLFGAASIYLDHTAQLNALFGDLYPVLQPALFIVIGVAIGWNLSKRRCHRNLDSLTAAHAAEIERIRADYEKRLSEKDAEIDRLKSKPAAAGQEEQQTAGPSLDAIMALSQRGAAGVLDAVRRLDDGERYVKFGDRVEDSLWLIGNSNGMITRHVTYFNGYHSKRNEYYVAPEWAAFLAIPENRKALEAMAFCSDWSS